MTGNSMKRFLTTAAFVTLSVIQAGPAHANPFDIYAKLKGGYVDGKGVTDFEMPVPGMASPAADYFELEKGPTLGLELGVELLFIDVSLSAYRFLSDGPMDKVDESDSGGTLFEGLVGLDVDIPLSEGSGPGLLLRLGGNAGIAFGLHQRVQPPLDEKEVADWGFVMHGIVALEYYFTKWFFLGAEIQPGYHYFVPGGDAVINEFSQGMQVMGFLTTGFLIQPFAGSGSSGKKKGSQPKKGYQPYRTPSTKPH